MVRIEFLGTGNAFLPQGRLHSLVLIDSHILVDVPLTVLSSLRRSNISPSEIDSLFITHLHADHTFGFPSFVIERKYISDRSGENMLHVYHAESAKKHLHNLCELAYPNSLIDRLENNTEWHDNNSGSISTNNDWEFERFEVSHDPASDPHGYLFSNKSAKLKLMHTGDSGPCSEIESRVPHCNVVIIEMGVPSNVDTPHHYNPDTLKRLADENPKVIFLITHHYIDDPSTKNTPVISNNLPKMPSNVFQPCDGDVFIWKNGILVEEKNLN